jgi:8-oxo-dGTP diphosphatase
MGSGLLLVAACALIDIDGRVLLAKRPPGRPLAGLWEFPGGKVEAGETPAVCLRRELTEELTATFTVRDLVETVRWEYPDRTVVLHFFDCRHESGPIVPREEQAMEWAEPARLATYDFPPADRELIQRLARQGGGTAGP